MILDLAFLKHDADKHAFILASSQSSEGPRGDFVQIAEEKIVDLLEELGYYRGGTA